MKQIAWGTSKLLKMYLERIKTGFFDYCVDNFFEGNEYCGIKVEKPNKILQEKRGSYQIIIFAVSNKSLQEISCELSGMGLYYKKDFIYYSDFFYDNFLKKAEENFGFKFNHRFYQFTLSYTLNSKISIHTTILGSWLFLELINHLNNVKGSIAEIGAFEGGNSLGSLKFMALLNPKDFYIFDSFIGFPELTEDDPAIRKKGDYNIKNNFNEIINNFLIFSEAKVIKGFIPRTFSQVPEKEKFSLVFYDCDLYQPCLDTLNFFWDKIVIGGYLLIHDYETEKGGFTGVRKATEKFFADKDIKLFSFFENTMAVVKK